MVIGLANISPHKIYLLQPNPVKYTGYKLRLNQHAMYWHIRIFLKLHTVLFQGEHLSLVSMTQSLMMFTVVEHLVFWPYMMIVTLPIQFGY